MPITTKHFDKPPNLLKQQQRMSQEEIRDRIVQELVTEIRRLVTLLETLAVEPRVLARDREEELQPILPELIIPEPVVQVAVPEVLVPQVIEEALPVIQVGDSVVITNRYGGLRGQTGRVTRVTQRQVVIRLDSSGRTVTKRKTSVEVIENS